MKILLINKYLYPKGGDAISTLNTGKLLQARGHEVTFWGMAHSSNPGYPYEKYFVSRIDYDKPGGISQQLKIIFRMLYSLEAKSKVEKLINLIKPDIVHLHNFAHQISPSILHVFKKQGIPVVMTMHDYKLVCPAYSLLSNGKLCERCMHKRYWWCLLKKCTKGSYVKSLVNVVEMYLHHRILRIYASIDIFISPSMFLKDMVRKMKFSGEIQYLPNFINLENYEPNYAPEQGTLVYFGRLSREKGIFTLLQAVQGLKVRLKIIGDGPLREELRRKAEAERLDNIYFLGYKQGQELRNEIKTAMAVIFPSECYENNPLSVLEAFALGKPVIGSRIGGIPELVKDGETGFTFAPGEVEDLREKIRRFQAQPELSANLGRRARSFAEDRFHPERHYHDLFEIYRRAQERHGNPGPHGRD